MTLIEAAAARITSSDLPYTVEEFERDLLRLFILTPDQFEALTEWVALKTLTGQATHLVLSGWQRNRAVFRVTADHLAFIGLPITK